MNKSTLSVREIEPRDIDFITDYWLLSDQTFLQNMGVDLSKMPDREQWQNMLTEQISQPYEQKKSNCIIWQVDGKAVGHSNVNKIIFGHEAYMHLHLWYPEVRQRGLGSTLVKMTLPYFFRNLNLKKIYCEPYALNPAPNNTLKKIGFELIKTYTTIPGYLNFEQQVNLWVLSHDQYLMLKQK